MKLKPKLELLIRYQDGYLATVKQPIRPENGEYFKAENQVDIYKVIDNDMRDLFGRVDDQYQQWMMYVEEDRYMSIDELIEQNVIDGN